MACGGETQPAQTAEPTAIQPTESPEETNSVGPLTADCIVAAFEAAMQALSDK